MLKKIRSILYRKKFRRNDRVILALFFLFIPLILFLSHVASQSFVHMHEQKRIRVISESFSQETQTLLQKVSSAQQEGEVEPYLEKNDPLTLSGILYRFTQKYGLWAMAVVDKNGLALARFPSLRIGDYVFQTSPWGVRVGKGETLVTVVQGRVYPLALVAGVPFWDQDQVRGALFGSHLLNDDYAFAFQKQYLSKAEQIVFYSTKSGAYGMTFENQEIKNLLKISFNEGSDWVQKQKNAFGNELFQIGDRFFHIGNIPLQGLDGQEGGMLIFFEVHHSRGLWVGVGILVLLFFLVEWYFFHVREKKSRFLITVFLSGVGVLIASVICVYFMDNTVGSREILDFPPYSIYNSTLALAPEFGLFSVGQEQRVQVQLTSGGEPINAVHLALSFNPQMVQLQDIFLINSLCDKKFILKKQVDNEKGKVNLSCLAPEGFVGINGLVAELIIVPLRVGQFDLTFEADTQVLAHDGLGTNVLRVSSGGSYTVAYPNTDNHNLSVFSYSHPNSARWYKNKNFHVQWDTRTSSKQIGFVVDQSPETIPSTGFVTTTEANVIVSKDGTYYFHIVEQGNNPKLQTIHWKFLVDTTPPENVFIRSSADRVRQGEIVRFEFGGTDALSGVQANYYVSMDGRMFVPSLKKLYVPFLEKGSHTITLRIFDNAGNFQDASKTIFVY